MVGKELNISTIHLDATGGLLLQVLLPAKGGEAPVLGDDDLLPARELVLRATKSLKSDSPVWIAVSHYRQTSRCQLTRVTSANAHDDLTNVDTGDGTVRLAPSTTHTSLQSIGTGARQHLVDTDDVVRMGTDTEMETFLASQLDEVLVGANASSLEGFRAQLLILVGDQVDAEGEVIDGRTLPAEVENADLGVRDTTVEPRLRIRL